VEIPTGESGWRTLGVVAPRRKWDESAILLPDCERARLTFLGAQELRYAGVFDAVTSAAPRSTELLDAKSAWSGDAITRVKTDGDSSLAMVAGDTLSLLFAELPAPDGGVRTWFLSVHGKPVSSSTAKGLSAHASDGERDAPPLVFALHQSVPNPARGSTNIQFELPVSARVLIVVYDAQGRRVRQFEGAYPPGRHIVEWDMRSRRGARVSPGIYLYRMTAGPFRDQRKVVVLP
jgi:hypothetical protein